MKLAFQYHVSQCFIGTTTVTMLLFITVPTILIVLSIIAILMFAILLFRKR